MKISQMTSKGNVRQKNEDSIYVSSKKDVFIVADGMGGHNAGEIASRAAIKRVVYYVRTKSELYPKNKKGMFELIYDAINYASRYIFILAKENEDYKGMGTTMVLTIVLDGTAYIGHVGDSRAYITSGEKIKQITSDHSLAEELYRSGSISKEEAQNHPNRNIITRALGGDGQIKVDRYAVKINNGSVLILCTDGLTNMISDKEILGIIKSGTTAKHAKSLVAQANKAGGTDNISVITIEKEKIG